MNRLAQSCADLLRGGRSLFWVFSVVNSSTCPRHRVKENCSAWNGERWSLPSSKAMWSNDLTLKLHLSTRGEFLAVMVAQPSRASPEEPRDAGLPTQFTRWWPSCSVVSWYLFLEWNHGVEQLIVLLSYLLMTADGQSKGLSRVNAPFFLLTLNESLLLITKVLTIGQNSMCSDTNFSLCIHICVGI